MAHPIFTGNPGYDPANSLCCWPNCYTRTDGLPICWHHARKAHAVVQATYSDLISERVAVETEPAPGYVYFLRFRDRIKIGFTSNTLARFQAIPHDEVIGFLPGTRLNERQCHTAFAHLREQGEWFRPEDDLLAFIADLNLAVA